MAVCLEYQAVYQGRDNVFRSWYCLGGACCILFLALAIKVAVKIQITNHGYSLAQAEQQALVLDTERRDLQLQLSVLKRRDTLEKKAKARLGLHSYSPAQTRYIQR
jgi:cell division protein FtsL